MPRSVLAVLNILLWIVRLTSCVSIWAYLKWQNERLDIVYLKDYDEVPEVHIAHASYDNQINQTGWAFFEVYTNNASTDEQQAFAAGYLEGYLTRDLIWYHRQNLIKDYCCKRKVICDKIMEYIEANDLFIEDMTLKNPEDPYWYQVKLIYIQIEGMAYGYNAATNNCKEKMDVKDMFWINLVCDLDELVVCMDHRMKPRTSREYLDLNLEPASIDRCSGLVKLLPDWSDLYVSHVTWNSYQSMLRLQKMYVLRYNRSTIFPGPLPGYKMSMSSYPAFVQSADDFVITSSGLVIGETTIGNTNKSLYNHINPTGSVLEFVRALVACRLARNGAEWAELFKQYNSGTYNNQWYIVDYKKFQAARVGRGGRRGQTGRRGRVAKIGRVYPGLLWVVEQMPGNMEAADLTRRLMSTSYFPSYNIAIFPRIFAISGGEQRVQQYGDWFGYNTNPRGKMIKQKQASIKNIGDLFVMMRYNDYLHDPLAHCPQCNPPYSACNAISARNDLNPANGTFPFIYLGHRSHGGTDTKVTSAQLRKHYMFLSIAGPTYNITQGILPFQWSKFDLEPNISHLGHPDLWTFAPIVHKWENRDRRNRYKIDTIQATPDEDRS